MRSRFVAFLSITILSSLASVAAAQDFDAEGEAAMLERINALRAEQQLAPLARLPELDAVARAHSSEMASRGELAHVSQRTGTPEDRVRAAGVPASAVAENVAMHRDAAQAQQALLDSPAHRANMLSREATHVGLGVVRTPQGVYATQVFAGVAVPRPAVAEAAPVAEPPAAAAPAAEPATAAAPAEPAAEADSIFGLIPPFLEQVLGAAPIAAPAEAPVAEAPSAPAAPSSGSRAPAAEAPTAARPATLPPATAATLRQLVGLAQSLLGASE